MSQRLLSRYIPAGSVEVKDDQSDGVVYVYATNGIFYGVAYHGKSSKPDWHYRFRNQADREKSIAKYFEGRRATVAAAEQRKADRKSATHGLTIGDILVASWGYEQTNINYYQVTATPTDKTVEIRAIAKSYEETGWCRGQSTPCPGQFIGEAVRYRAAKGQIKITDYKYAHKLAPEANGTFRSHYESSYA
ncbi:MAG: hypothetical protein WCJ64_00575 [Rhodospirillaceae bacterium]